MKIKVLKIAVLAIFLFSGTNAFAYYGGSGSNMVMAFSTLLFLLVTVTLYGLARRDSTKDTIHIEGKDATGWDKIKSSLTSAVQVGHEEDIMLDHEYDGIRELGNKLPPWWNYLYMITIAFALIYVTYYSFLGMGPTSVEEWTEEMKVAKAEVKAASGGKEAVTEANVTLLKDEASVSKGKEIFAANCTPCHGALGEGNTIGPNLTDEYWIYGGKINNLFHTITNGTNKGMQAWKGVLKPEEIQKVASFVLVKLQGSNPPNAKAPQGKKES